MSTAMLTADRPKLFTEETVPYEQIVGEYKKLKVRQREPFDLSETREAGYWRAIRNKATETLIGSITAIDFSPAAPFNFCATAGTRVKIYDAKRLRSRRTISQFKGTAYSGSFRGDGKAIVAGGEDGTVQVFDAATRTILRQLKGHKTACHVARFSPEKLQVLSAGDDTTIRYWDLSDGTQLLRMTGHSDYVRSASANPVDPAIWATGSYDHTIKLWDTRSAQCILTLDHGDPVETVNFYPQGSLLISTGGTNVRVWDMAGASGRQLLHTIGSNLKTVTAACIAPRAGRPPRPGAPGGMRLLTGSLDGKLKVYTLDSYQLTYESQYKSSILSLAMSPRADLLAVGCADGLLSIRGRDAQAAEGEEGEEEEGEGPAAAPAKRPRPMDARDPRFFGRGPKDKPTETDTLVGGQPTAAPKPTHLSGYDKLLRKFRYGDALDAALATGNPDVVDAMLNELQWRGGLMGALGGRDAERLLPLLRHITRHIVDVRHTRPLTAAADAVLDIYAGLVGASPQVDEQLMRLRDLLHRDAQVTRALLQLKGLLAPLLAGLRAGETGQQHQQQLQLQ